MTDPQRDARPPQGSSGASSSGASSSGASPGESSGAEPGGEPGGRRGGASDGQRHDAGPTPASPPPAALLPGPADAIARGYAFTGPALELGALVWDGTCHPGARIRLPLGMLNRHGLVAGATGTGKTKTLQLIAEQLSAGGVPVFLADVKGDLSGLAAPGRTGDRVAVRAAEVGQDWSAEAFPCEFYALGGKGTGIPLRATVTGFGPILMSKVLELDQAQEQALGMIFHYADTRGLELHGLKDLRAVIAFLTSDEGKGGLTNIGGISAATAGVLMRTLTAFEAQGADAFFGEPEFDTAELLRTASDGRGMLSILELPAVQDRPQLFSTFLMWLLADLFQDLPEAGDVDRPKLVFFVDEAQLLFNDASRAFLESITQTVRLIRSKGVGIFFVTRTPKDVPSGVLSQLGNRIQHALRAFTPEDAKVLKATVSTFPNSVYNLEEVLTALGTGEAVVTVLSENGVRTPVAVTRLRAPRSLMGPLDADALAAAVEASPLHGRYAQAADRVPAYEKPAAAEQEERTAGAAPEKPEAAPPGGKPQPEEEQGPVDRLVGSEVFTSLARSVGTRPGREIIRSLFGTRLRR